MTWINLFSHRAPMTHLSKQTGSPKSSWGTNNFIWLTYKACMKGYLQEYGWFLQTVESAQRQWSRGSCTMDFCFSWPSISLILWCLPRPLVVRKGRRAWWWAGDPPFLFRELWKHLGGLTLVEEVCHWVGKLWDFKVSLHVQFNFCFMFAVEIC